MFIISLSPDTQHCGIKCTETKPYLDSFIDLFALTLACSVFTGLCMASVRVSQLPCPSSAMTCSAVGHLPTLLTFLLLLTLVHTHSSYRQTPVT